MELATDRERDGGRWPAPPSPACCSSSWFCWSTSGLRGVAASRTASGISEKESSYALASPLTRLGGSALAISNTARDAAVVGVDAAVEFSLCNELNESCLLREPFAFVRRGLRDHVCDDVGSENRPVVPIRVGLLALCAVVVREALGVASASSASSSSIPVGCSCLRDSSVLLTMRLVVSPISGSSDSGMFVSVWKDGTEFIMIMLKPSPFAMVSWSREAAGRASLVWEPASLLTSKPVGISFSTMSTVGWTLWGKAASGAACTGSIVSTWRALFLPRPLTTGVGGSDKVASQMSSSSPSAPSVTAGAGDGLGPSGAGEGLGASRAGGKLGLSGAGEEPGPSRADSPGDAAAGSSCMTTVASRVTSSTVVSASSRARGCRRGRPLFLGCALGSAFLAGVAAFRLGVFDAVLLAADPGGACEPATLSSDAASSSGAFPRLRFAVWCMGVPARFLGRGVGVPGRPGGRPRLFGVDAPTTPASSSSVMPFSGTVIVVVFSRRRIEDLGVADVKRRRLTSSILDFSVSTVTRIFCGESPSPTSSSKVRFRGELLGRASKLDGRWLRVMRLENGAAELGAKSFSGSGDDKRLRLGGAMAATAHYSASIV